MLEKLIKAFFMLIGLVVSVIPICVFGLDWKLMADIVYRASFSIKEFNQSVSYSAIFSAVVVINFIFLFVVFGATIGLIIFSIVNLGEIKLTIIYTLTGIFLFFSIPKESITYKFITCFAFNEASFVQARATLMIVYVIGIFGFSLIFLYNIRQKEKLEISFFTIGFILFILSVITICGLNIAMLVKLSFTSMDINPKSIKMALFKVDEIEQIKSGRFVKEKNFDERTLGVIHDVVFSETKHLNSVDCSDNDCSTLYKRYYRKEIDCGQVLSKDKFIDCQQNISKVIFKFRYIDDGEYPVYNCLTLDKKNDCKLDCQLLENYGVYLVQEFSDIVEPAWNGFGKCEVVQPKFDLDLDKSLQVECASFDSGSECLKKNSIFIFLFILFFMSIK
ncbi:hypothetical protein BpHYR1_040419 [Brachionus plicatilis]|uniref:Uncharacterized protein n=1 Tax=Brachionus plicatilis TaxID=10195 RepID=A0A3M7P7X4_BRAPC|nr:hypothetical protein BpHYR1_040419 [Brachionus plicatilis]